MSKHRTLGFLFGLAALTGVSAASGVAAAAEPVVDDCGAARLLKENIEIRQDENRARMLISGGGFLMTGLAGGVLLERWRRRRQDEREEASEHTYFQHQIAEYDPLNTDRPKENKPN